MRSVRSAIRQSLFRAYEQTVSSAAARSCAAAPHQPVADDPCPLSLSNQQLHPEDTFCGSTAYFSLLAFQRSAMSPLPSLLCKSAAIDRRTGNSPTAVDDADLSGCVFCLGMGSSFD